MLMSIGDPLRNGVSSASGSCQAVPRFCHHCVTTEFTVTLSFLNLTFFDRGAAPTSSAGTRCPCRSPIDDRCCAQHAKNLVGRQLRWNHRGLDAEFRTLRYFIGRVDTGEVPQFATPGFAVQTFRISALRYLNRCVYEDFDEFTWLEQFARHLPFRTKR